MKQAAALLLVGLMSACATAAPLKVQTKGYSAEFERGALTALKDAGGNVFVAGEMSAEGVGIRRVGQDHWAQDDLGPALLDGARTTTLTYSQIGDLPGASIRAAYRVEEDSGDLILTQEAKSPEPGVWGVEWTIGHVPLDMNIIVPGRSGIKLTTETPGNTHTFDYPIAWEAQLVIVEGDGRGFYVWADDADGGFKRLTVTRREEGWRLGLATVNYAPFDELKACDSATWRLNVYKGDWRVPARRYRDWMEANLRPTRVEEQQPKWVKDIRCVVIMGMDIPTMEALTTRLDPEQTLLYIPSWREAGYDRDYPVYDETFEQWEPFVKRAHELGYRVMPHVNYFGVDPLNELYAQFEQFQCRSPWGNHDKQWWLWERATPTIKFAYINPAHKPWRELFVARMKELCERCEVDALHLDQTLCVFNDHNGLMDGMSMIQGNIALHRDLREALPQVALSGEGLNEVTYRYEAFAQRHTWGLSHVEGTWSRRHLEAAHPISSYLLRPYTIIYGYLGCAHPTNGQLYAAWNEAYQYWGVIPTLKPSRRQIENPTGFSRQFYDEVKFWQDERLDIDVDRDWPDEVAFPYRTASGKWAARMADRRLVVEKTEISRTISGVTEVKLPGSLTGWRVYDSERIFGLDPEAWYPYVADPRDMDVFHVEAVPEGFRASGVVAQEDMATVRTEQTGGVVADLAELIDDATCGSTPFEGEPVEVKGPLYAEDGAHFTSEGSVINAHPPWKAERKNPDTGAIEAGGTGVAYARYKVKLPAEGELHFVAEVAIEKGAVGQDNQDGVTFAVAAREDGLESTKEVHNDRSERAELELDLTEFAGKEIELELSVHPGPDRSASFDWARWHRPRIEQDISSAGEIVIGGKQRWSLALSGTEMSVPQAEGGRYRVATTLPGAIILLRDVKPKPVTLPLDISAAELRVSFMSEGGQALQAPQYAGAQPAADQTVGGVARDGLAAHPPDHGRTIIDLALELPDQAAELHSFVGIRDGSTSEGVIFIVEANGVEVMSEFMVPGEWRELTADLSPWAGKTAVISLITDSDGGFHFDWAAWGEPVIRAE